MPDDFTFGQIQNSTGLRVETAQRGYPLLFGRFLHTREFGFWLSGLYTFAVFDTFGQNRHLHVYRGLLASLFRQIFAHSPNLIFDRLHPGTSRICLKGGFHVTRGGTVMSSWPNLAIGWTRIPTGMDCGIYLAESIEDLGLVRYAAGRGCRHISDRRTVLHVGYKMWKEAKSLFEKGAKP